MRRAGQSAALRTVLAFRVTSVTVCHKRGLHDGASEGKHTLPEGGIGASAAVPTASEPSFSSSNPHASRTSLEAHTDFFGDDAAPLKTFFTATAERTLGNGIEAPPSPPSLSQPQLHHRRRRPFPRATFAGTRAPRGEHGRRGQSASPADALPMVHPGAHLPPLPQHRMSERRAGKFSFVSDPSERVSRDHYGHEVPNNTPKAKLPMWASSLTSPALGKARLQEESWISQDARGSIDAAVQSSFLEWLSGGVLSCAAPLRKQLETNVRLDLRRATARGVYARRAFQKGDVVLTIPLVTATEAAAAAVEHPGQALLTLNSEVLEKVSTAARQRSGMPTFDDVRRLLSVRHSSFDPIPHPLFLDQVRMALLLACEKAEGEESLLFPYMRLLDSRELFDDDRIEELHRGVLDPLTHLEYGEHCRRFRHYLRVLHTQWWAAYAALSRESTTLQVTANELRQERRASGEEMAAYRSSDHHTLAAHVGGEEADTLEEAKASVTFSALDLRDTIGEKEANEEMAAPLSPSSVRVPPPPPPLLRRRREGSKPPPSLDDLEWALRVTLSRQRMLPGLREHLEAFQSDAAESAEGGRLDAFAAAVMKGKRAFYDRVSGAIDNDRRRTDRADPSVIPTVVVLLDMIGHPPGGVGNVAFSVEYTNAGSAHELPSSPSSPATVEGVDGRNKKLSSHDSSAAAEAATAAEETSPRYQIVVRATDDVEEEDELTLSNATCYSVAYTLYRYAFLPLGRREDDMSACLDAVGSTLDSRQPPPSWSAKLSVVKRCVRRWWSSRVGR